LKNRSVSIWGAICRTNLFEGASIRGRGAYSPYPEAGQGLEKKECRKKEWKKMLEGGKNSVEKNDN